MTKITFQDEFGTYTIEINKDGMSLPVLIEDLVRPLLLAAGYAQENIDEVFHGE